MIDNEDLVINSEIIWSFSKIKEELSDSYPNGKSLTEQLTTIDGLYTWKIEFYPNGKDAETKNKLYVSLTLINVKAGAETNVDAECNYYLICKENTRNNYVGKIDRRNYTKNSAETDSSFESKILHNCPGNCTVSLSIKQFPKDDKVEPMTIRSRVTEVSSAQPTYANDANDFEEDFQKVTVATLH